jgi:hypothetical protein
MVPSKLNDNILTTTDVEEKEKFYTVYGKHDFIDSQNNPRINIEDKKRICAKEVRGKYSIRMASDGSLYDPNSMFNNILSEQEIHKAVHIPYRPVKKIVFDIYMKYLQTKNNVYIRQAEREAF